MTLETVNWKRENVWLRQLLMGPSGAGKTTGALEIATNLFGGSLDVVGVDSERGRMKLYADRYRLKDYAQLNDDHSPEAWKGALEWAYRVAPGGVVVLDSFSHEWMGKGGVLQIVDRFGDWKEVRPRHTDLLDFMLGLPMHIIVCVRAKMKYEVGEREVPGRDKPQQVIRKLGIGPVQDDAIIYEFDIVGTIDAQTHVCTFSNRCDPLVDTEHSLMPGKPVAEIITDWLSSGDAPDAPEEAPEERVAELVALLKECGISDAKIEVGMSNARARGGGVLTPEYVDQQITMWTERKKTAAPAAQPAQT